MSLLSESHASYINLDTRTDRLVLMQAALTKAGLTATRTRGIPWREIKGVESPPYQVMYKRTPGAIGCHLSQVKVMQDALTQSKHAFVMEDDLIFCEDFLERIVLMEKFIATHPWDILWLGGTVHIHEVWWHKKDLGFDASRTDDPRFVRTFGAFSTHAYLVNKDSIANILALLDQWLPQSIGIDWAMIQMQPKLQTFMMLPGAVKQRDNRSDIGNGDTIFSGFSKLGKHWWADRMTEFSPENYDWGFCK